MSLASGPADMRRTTSCRLPTSYAHGLRAHDHGSMRTEQAPVSRLENREVKDGSWKTSRSKLMVGKQYIRREQHK